MESWRTVLRQGFFPNMPTNGLIAAQKALASDDPRLIQGSTTTPPPLMCVQDWPVEAADFIGFVYWQSGTLEANTVGVVEEAFARACFDADQVLGEPAACRWFLNHWDQEPRHRLFSEMLDEVNMALASRAESPVQISIDEDEDDFEEDDSENGCPVGLLAK